MAHDFASNQRRSQKTKAKSKKKLPLPSLGTLLSMLAVLGFGFGLYLLGGVTPQTNEKAVTASDQGSKTNASIPSPISEQLSTNQTKEMPTYTFYEKLKQMQSWDPGELVEIRKPKEEKPTTPKRKPDQRPASVAPSVSTTSTAASRPSPLNTAPRPVHKKYILQAGSYGNFEDANNQRVKLIINGIRNTTIDTVTLNNGKISHRIEVGPFQSQQALKEIKQQLASLKVSSFSRTLK